MSNINQLTQTWEAASKQLNWNITIDDKSTPEKIERAELHKSNTEKLNQDIERANEDVRKAKESLDKVSINLDTLQNDLKVLSQKKEFQLELHKKQIVQYQAELESLKAIEVTIEQQLLHEYQRADSQEVVYQLPLIAEQDAWLEQRQKESQQYNQNKAALELLSTSIVEKQH